MEMSSALGAVNLNDIGITAPKKTNEKDDQNQFLQLFVAQLRNQNPLEPQEGADFLAQLAQFSTVEGITNMEKAISSLANTFDANRAVQAASLVGKNVEVKSQQANLLPGKLAQGSVELPQSVTNLKIEILNASGEVVKNYDLGFQERGFVPFSWDGTNNDQDNLPGGKYNVLAKGLVGGKEVQFETYMNSSVNSITLSKDTKDTLLNVDGVGQVTMSQIRSIS